MKMVENLLPTAAHWVEAGDTAPFIWTVTAAEAVAQLPWGVGVVARMCPVSGALVAMPMV